MKEILTEAYKAINGCKIANEITTEVIDAYASVLIHKSLFSLKIAVDLIRNTIRSMRLRPIHSTLIVSAISLMKSEMKVQLI